MSIHRWNAKTDSPQAAIVHGLIQAGVRVWVIKQPCDLLCYCWSNPRQAFIWQPLEVKTPKKSGKVRKRSDQRAQNDFLAETRTPVVTCLEDALSALGLPSNPATSATCTSKPISGPATSAASR